jgi:hypothetical protein
MPFKTRIYNAYAALEKTPTLLVFLLCIGAAILAGRVVIAFSSGYPTFDTTILVIAMLIVGSAAVTCFRAHTRAQAQSRLEREARIRERIQYLKEHPEEMPYRFNDTID